MSRNPEGEDPDYFSEEEGITDGEPSTSGADGAAPPVLTLLDSLAASPALAEEAGSDSPRGVLHALATRLKAVASMAANAQGEDEEGDGEISDTADGPARTSRFLNGHRSRLDELRASIHGGAASRRPGVEQTLSRDVRDVPLSSVDCRGPVDNPRTTSPDDEDERALGESIEAIGQLQPCPAVESRMQSGRFHIVGGFRRHAALSRIGSPSIRILVLPANTPVDVLASIAVADNSRVEINNVDLAHAAIHARDQLGISLAEFSRRSGFNEGRIKWITSAIEKLPADIIADWRAGHPRLNRHLILRLKNMARDAASSFWAQKKAAFELEERASFVEEREYRNRQPSERPAPRILDRLWSVLRRCDRTTFTLDELVELLDYCRGVSHTIPFLAFDARARTPSAPRAARGGRGRRRHDDRELPLPGRDAAALGGEP